ncbi:hypothetical protein HUT06_03975 [Actinomadura sp. NAK00032]|uniref:hypothetical protein n=1 Tax=Actinomadura sp. NAK00032 TaxID=2742128 RepID=UPI0015926B24|nr:hypothetical protein [Actinomadura sp. NAK00032]QKW33290.1 hypothetical protein HUT06_03975 [Actinomadura sp. NAK00032]
MSELPEEIRAEVIKELYRQAEELDWELLSSTEKKLQYRRWIDDPRIGGALRPFFDDHRIGTWIKDTPMKEYARAQEGFGAMARYVRSRFPSPEQLIARTLGERWSVVPDSVDDKPMHCLASDGQTQRYVCWGRPKTFRDLTWAALNQAVDTGTKPLIVVTLQDGLVVSDAEKERQTSIAEHCGIDIRYVHRHLRPKAAVDGR